MIVDFVSSPLTTMSIVTSSPSCFMVPLAWNGAGPDERSLGLGEDLLDGGVRDPVAGRRGRVRTGRARGVGHAGRERGGGEPTGMSASLMRMTG